MISNVKGVLFDLDETLIDDFVGLESAHRAVARELHRHLGERGAKVSEDDLFTKVSEEELVTKITKLDDKMNLKRKYIRNDWWPLLLEQMGVKVELPREVLDRLTLLYWETFADNTRPYPDAEETLRYLKGKGYKLGIITDTDGTDGIKKMRLSRLNITKFFDSIVIAGEDTPKTKPDPVPYLRVAKELGVEPGECVFVGDKPFTDIDGGNKAGMKTVLLKRRDWGVEDNSNFIIKQLAELRDIL